MLLTAADRESESHGSDLRSKSARPNDDSHSMSLRKEKGKKRVMPLESKVEEIKYKYRTFSKGFELAFTCKHQL